MGKGFGYVNFDTSDAVEKVGYIGVLHLPYFQPYYTF